jgi:thioredoxin 1
MSTGAKLEVTDAAFSGEVLESDVPVLVDFWAPWCGPCRMVAPVLEKIAGEYAGQVKVCEVNIDNERETAMQYGIMSIPTLLLFKSGQVVEQITGVTPNFENDLKSKIDSHL